MVTVATERMQRRGQGRVAESLAVAVALLLWFAPPAHAEFSCRAEVNRQSVEQGGIVVLTVTAEGDVEWSARFELPALKDVQVSSGGTNQSMSFINGRRSTSLSRTYYLRVDGAEDLEIGPVRVVSGSDECSTDPVRVRVTETDRGGNVPPADTGNRTPRPEAGRRSEAVTSGMGAKTGGQPGDDVFVTLDIDQEQAWVGQQLLLRFRYYRRVQPWNNPKYTAPRTEGFWREDLGPERNTRETVGGRPYNVTEIRYALFPAHAGDLEIGPAQLEFPEDVFDRFFSSRRREGPRVLRTEPITVHVRALPQPAPEGFSGLVASTLTLTAEVDRDTVPRGEPVGLKVKLASDAFLQGFAGLKIEEPADARLHDAGEGLHSTPRRDRLFGEMSVEKVLVPSREGEFQVQPVKLSWFDAGQGRYREARTRPHAVEVLPSDLPLADDGDSGFLRNEIARLGQDLAFVHRGGDALRERTAPAPGRALWWVLLLLPLALLGGWRLLLVRASADRRDPEGRRRRRAWTTARASLADAARIGSDVDRMDAWARALTGFVADCTGRPAAAVGADEVREFCLERDCPDAVQPLLEVLDAADRIRYGGGAGATAPSDAAELERLLQRLHAADRRLDVPAGTGGGARLAIWLTLLAAAALTDGAQAQPMPAPGADPARLLAEGNQAYTEGDVDTALDRYREALELGAADADLYFNLGNTYARRGELGRAVVSYLRAERLDPRDGDIDRNLAWVRSHIQDLELDSGELPLFIGEFVALVHWFTLDEWSWLLVLLVWLAAGGVAWGWYREDFGTHLRRSLLALAAVLVVVLGITGWRYHDEEVARQAVIVVPSEQVRSGPADTFPVLFELHDGLTLRVEEERSGWVRIGLGGDWVGWIPVASVEEVRGPRT